MMPANAISLMCTATITAIVIIWCIAKGWTMGMFVYLFVAAPTLFVGIKRAAEIVLTWLMAT